MLKCTGLYWFAVVVHRSAKKKLFLFFLQIKKNSERTCTLNPKCYVEGPLLHVDHSRSTSSLANVENEHVRSSSALYSALIVQRFTVCDPYIFTFDKGRDSGHILVPRGTHNRLQCPCNTVKQGNMFNSESVHAPWFWMPVGIVSCTWRLYVPLHKTVAIYTQTTQISHCVRCLQLFAHVGGPLTGKNCVLTVSPRPEISSFCHNSHRTVQA